MHHCQGEARGRDGGPDDSNPAHDALGDTGFKVTGTPAPHRNRPRRSCTVTAPSAGAKADWPVFGVGDVSVRSTLYRMNLSCLAKTKIELRAWVFRHHRRWDARGFEDRWHDVDDVLERVANAACVLYEGSSRFLVLH